MGLNIEIAQRMSWVSWGKGRLVGGRGEGCGKVYQNALNTYLGKVKKFHKDTFTPNRIKGINFGRSGQICPPPPPRKAE